MVLKNIKIHYYAVLREDTRVDSETIALNANNASDVYHFLNNKYHLSLKKEFLSVSINNEFQEWDTPINDGDSLVFIPPVSGGS